MAVRVLLGVAALAWLYSRKRQLHGAAEGQFKEFRERAVALMDQLDALRQRYKTLPLTDPDFTASMSGATLAQYNTVEADLNALWERWLKIMELLGSRGELVRSVSGLAVREAEEARNLLDQGNTDKLLRQTFGTSRRSGRRRGGGLRLAHDLVVAAVRRVTVGRRA
jgi:hypothetical protein